MADSDSLKNVVPVKWYNTEDNQFPPIQLRVVTSKNEIGYFTGNYKFINEIDNSVSIDEIIWTYLPIYNVG